MAAKHKVTNAMVDKYTCINMLHVYKLELATTKPMTCMTTISPNKV